MSGSGRGAAAGGAASDRASAGLFIVERRLLAVDEYQLAVVQAALSAAASRFSGRGDGVRYRCSIFVARQERLLSLFMAGTAEAVRAVNQAALIPFTGVEPAIELPGLAGPWLPPRPGPGGVPRP